MCSNCKKCMLSAMSVNVHFFRLFCQQCPHPPLVNKTCLCRVTHALFLFPSGLNLLSAVPVAFWKSASAFVKPLPCVHRALVAHAVTLIYKWVGTRKKKESKGTCFFVVVWIGKYQKWRINSPLCFSGFTTCASLSGFRIITLSQTCNCNIILKSVLVTWPLLSSSDSHEPGVHSFPLYIHCAPMQAWTWFSHPAAIQAPPGGSGRIGPS